MANDLTGRTIIITGASSGIGAATALACARAGMNVVLGARRRERLEEVAAQVRALGARAEIVVGCVTCADTNTRLLDTAERAFGGFHAVFANAGYGHHRAIHSFDAHDLRRLFEVNFFACAELLAQAARRLIDRGLRGQFRGHLLMCSSCVSRITIAGHGAYSATKAAQNHICRGMRLELAPHGIHVTSVHPIPTVTEFFTVADALSDPAYCDTRILETTPRLFIQRPERVARAVVRCLRRPRAEIWTSHLVRYAAGVMTIWPGLMDMAMRRRLRPLAAKHAPAPAGIAAEPTPQF